MRAWPSVLAASLGLAAALPFLASTPEGPPPAPIPVPETRGAPPAEEPSRALYGWRDGNGVVHLSTDPPTSDHSYWIHRYVDPPVEDDVDGPGPITHRPDPETGLAEDPLSVYSQEGLTELRQRLDHVRRGLQQRHSLLDELSEGL